MKYPLWRAGVLGSLGALVLTLAGCSRSSSSSPAPAPNPAGQLDTSFNTTGIVTSNPSSAIDEAVAVVTDGTNIWVVGSDQSPGAGNSQWRIECYDVATGSPVTGFGASGVITNGNPSANDDQPVDAIISGTSLIIVGYDEAPGAGNAQWRIEKRSLATGALDTSFNTTGIVQTNPTGLDDQPTAVLADSTSLYIVGYDYPSAGNWQWRIEKRSLSTGSLDATFNSSGVQTYNPSAGDDQATHAVLVGASLFVVGYDETNGAGDEQWVCAKYSASSGLLDGTFGGGSGVVTVNPSSSTDQPVRIVYDGTDLVIGGLTFIAGPGDFGSRLEKRDTTNGGFVAAFGTAGVISTNFSSNNGVEFFAPFFDGTHLYAGGRDQGAGAGDQRWRVERRVVSSGALDGAFGSGGVLTVNPSGGVDNPGSLAFTATHFFAVGGDYSPGTTDAQWRIQKHSK